MSKELRSRKVEEGAILTDVEESALPIVMTCIPAKIPGIRWIFDLMHSAYVVRHLETKRIIGVRCHNTQQGVGAMEKPSDLYERLRDLCPSAEHIVYSSREHAAEASRTDMQEIRAARSGSKTSEDPIW